jgi:hypothetical protein
VTNGIIRQLAEPGVRTTARITLSEAHALPLPPIGREVTVSQTLGEFRAVGMCTIPPRRDQYTDQEQEQDDLGGHFYLSNGIKLCLT